MIYLHAYLKFYKPWDSRYGFQLVRGRDEISDEVRMPSNAMS
jgi:hypothetical protein